jgi:hypothetical protein
MLKRFNLELVNAISVLATVCSLVLATAYLLPAGEQQTTSTLPAELASSSLTQAHDAR